VGEHTSLALDQAGRVHVGYLDAANGALRHAGRARDAFRLVTASVHSAAGAADDRVGPAAGLVLAAGPLPYSGGSFAGTLSIAGGAVDAAVSLVDVAGRHVRALTVRELEPGRLGFTWDGRDDTGRPVRDGVYFLLGRAGGKETKLKLVVIR
jgi:hypothetical protein